MSAASRPLQASIAFTPGDVLVYRVGDGAAALSSAAAAVFIDEYNPTGGPVVQSIALPTSGASELTAVGNATTEGIISMSQDGTSFVFTGYRKDAGLTSPASDTYVTTPRVVGIITAAGTPDTSTTISNDNGATTANTIRSAASVNGTPGSPLWVSTSTRVSYDGTGIGGTGGTTQIDARNSRQALIANNIFYASNGSTTIAAKVQSYGTLPTGATAGTAVATLNLTDAVNGFDIFDVNPLVAGPDTLYALSTVDSTLRKFVFDGSAWTAAGSVSSNAQNISGVVIGSNVNLYLASTSTLSIVTDTSGPGGTLTATPAPFATAATNTAFRGIGFLPEPSSIAMLILAAPTILARRRRLRQ